ncbi:MAG TPA: amidohydrolase [Bryobacteraceae bacterium]|nr:amidohydrolase [Bryobacterales bacterium]HRJ17690.1 amidohydrolase [Bryobacteraceae bacterium]
MVKLFFLFLCSFPLFAVSMILHNGRVVTQDSQGSIHQAVAVRDGRIVATGPDAAILAMREAGTQVIDLGGRMVLPGLIDPHVHALGGALSEYREKLPPLDSIAAIQKWIVEKAKSTPKGEWIVVPRTLPPRLREMRMPTRADLDVVKTHPVAFDGSYVWSANSMALAISGITKDTPNPPGGEVVKGPDGEPNGILRAASGLLKGVRTSKPFTEEERLAALEKMLQIYAEAGLTTIGDRAVGPADVALFEKLHRDKRLAVRTVLTWRINTNRPMPEVLKEIRENPWTTNQGDEWLKFGTFKVTLDGGQSVGTAYQRMPYGPFGRQLYGQTNPDARGTLFVEPDDLYTIFAAARDKGWQLTSHVQGGSAIDILLDVFERLDKVKPIAPTRSHVMHGSFMSPDALQRMKRMGIVADVQPHWLHLDVPALRRVFGLDNMRWFFPLRSMIEMGIVTAGGSDHMIGHDKDKAVNPFNPFYGMWMSITRRTTEGQVVYPEECVTREQALKMFTIWPAYMIFDEKVKGTIEKGKYADLTVIDRDYFKCPEDEIREIQPVMTIVGGQIRHRKM